SGRTSSSVPLRDPTRSPTARTGCDRTTTPPHTRRRPGRCPRAHRPYPPTRPRRPGLHLLPRRKTRRRVRPRLIPAPAPRPLRRTSWPPTRPRACPESWFRTEPDHDPAMVADRMGAAAGGDPAVDVGLRLAGPELAANARNSGRRARLVRRAGADA